MKFLRGASRWLLSLIIILMLSTWIGVSVAQATILNRQTVKTWLASSGTYDKALRSFFTLDNSQGIATKNDIQNAFDATFPPRYVQQQTEVVLNATYDWIDGKAQAITFSIPLKDKRDDFTANLKKQIEPRIAALPTCPTRANPATDKPTCIPQGMKASDLTDQLLRLSDDNDFLQQPITATTFAQSGQQLPSLSYLPALASVMRVLVLALPVGILLCMTAYVLLSDSKLRGLSIISRRMLFFHGLLFAVIGGLVWWFTRTIDLSAAAQAADIQQLFVLKNVITPIVRIALPDIGRALAVYGGGVAVVGGIIWLAGSIIRRKITHHNLLNAPTGGSLPPKPIADPPSQNTPTPPQIL